MFSNKNSLTLLAVSLLIALSYGQDTTTEIAVDNSTAPVDSNYTKTYPTYEEDPYYYQGVEEEEE